MVALTPWYRQSAPQMNSRTTDAISIAKAQLRQLQSEIRAALPAYKDANSRAHLQDAIKYFQLLNQRTNDPYWLQTVAELEKMVEAEASDVPAT